MPEVTFCYDPAKVDEDLAFGRIVAALPKAIAGAFNQLGESRVLTEKDIGVHVTPIGRFDRNISPISIRITANRTRARKTSLNNFLKPKVVEAIRKIPALKDAVGPGECSILVELTDMAFETI